MKRSVFLVFSSILLFFLAACGNPGVNSSAPTQTSQPTTIPSPIPTATPSAGRVVVVAPPEILPVELQTIMDAIQPIISESGLAVETLSQAPSGTFGPNRVAAIFLSSPPNLVEILAANPQTQIIVVSGNDLQPGPNFTVLRVRPEYQAFMAGFISVLAAPNWRSAGLLPYDGGDVNLMANAYSSGGRYFCGRCGTVAPPFAPYPLTESAARGASPAEWQAAAANILPAGVEVMFLSKEAQSPELIQSLASQNILFLGSVSPGDGIQERWIGTVISDIPGTLAKILPDVISGQGGRSINVGVILTDINEAYITPGRQRLILETNEELIKGWISPYTITN